MRELRADAKTGECPYFKSHKTVRETGVYLDLLTGRAIECISWRCPKCGVVFTAVAPEKRKK